MPIGNTSTGCGDLHVSFLNKPTESRGIKVPILSSFLFAATVADDSRPMLDHFAPPLGFGLFRAAAA